MLFVNYKFHLKKIYGLTLDPSFAHILEPIIGRERERERTLTPLTPRRHLQYTSFKAWDMSFLSKHTVDNSRLDYGKRSIT